MGLDPFTRLQGILNSDNFNYQNAHFTPVAAPFSKKSTFFGRSFSSTSAVYLMRDQPEKISLNSNLGIYNFQNGASINATR